MRLNYSRNREPLICENNRRATVFAAFLAVSPLACAPTRGEVRGVAGTKIVVMHEDTYRDLEARTKTPPQNPESERVAVLIHEVETLRERNTELRDRNYELEAAISDLRKAAEIRRSVTSRSARDKPPPLESRLAKLYFDTLGIRNPTYNEYQSLINVLTVQAIIKQVTEGQLLDPSAQKAEIKNNYIEVNGAGGVLLSTDGWFITAYHVVANSEYFSVNYNGRNYSATRVVWNQSYEVALCKIDFGDIEFRPTNVRFAALRKIRKGANIEVFGRVGSNEYFQMGKITDNDVHSSLDNKQEAFSMVQTSAFSTGGFSGGPVVLADTGELVGITSYSQGLPGPLGAARIDRFLEVMRWYVTEKLKELQAAHHS